MKLFKKLFSRTAIVLFAILLQVLIYTYVMSSLAQSYLYISLPFRALAFIFVLVVINRDMSASYKVPWLIVLLVMPIIGTILYLVLGYPRPKRKQRKILALMHERTALYTRQDRSVVESLRAENALAAGQAVSLTSSSEMPLFTGTYTRYFSSGEEAFAHLKRSLEGAKRFVFMEYFIIDEGKMWGEILEILKLKVRQGVEVRIMYDDFGCSGTLKHNYCKKMREMGISCVKFGRITPLLTAVHNNRDHRKITVVDGAEAFTGGYNLSDEYINETSPYGYWKDTGLYLRGEAVRNFTLMFLRMYAAQSDEVFDFSKYLDVQCSVPARGYVLPFGDGPAPVYSDYIGEEVYLNIINQAQRYVYITTPYLIVDYHFTKALKAAAKRGVDVRIITPGIPDKKLVNIMTKSSYFPLVSAGVKIYEFSPGFIHAKSFVCDDAIGVVGTINLDYRSLVHHYECGVWMYDTPAVSEIKTDFDNTLFKCVMIDENKARLKWYQRIVSSILMVFAPLM